MNKFLLLILIIFTLLCINNVLYSEMSLDDIKNKLPKMLGASNTGTEFVFGFHPAFEEQGNNNFVRIYISSTVETEVRLTIPALSSEPYKIKKTIPHDIIEFTLTPNEAQPYTRIPSGSKQTLKPTQIWPGRGIIIESDDPIIVYGMVRYTFTSDGFLALPVNALGNEYIISSYRETSDFTYQSLTPYADIISVFDNTHVTLYIGGNKNSRIRTLDDKLWKPFEVLQADLNRGDFWLIASEGAKSDLGGCKVVANKPISVISGNHCAYVPTEIAACDYLIEQELPIISWDKKYYVTPIIDRKRSSIIRLFGKDANTNYYRNGVLIGSLKGDFGIENEAWKELRTSPDYNYGATYTADKPFYIMQYNTGMRDDSVHSDPFQMMLMPESLFQNELIFNTPGIRGGYGFDKNYVNIVYKSVNKEIPDDLEFGEVVSTDVTNWKKVKDINPMPGDDLNDPDFKGTNTSIRSITLSIPNDGVYRLRCLSQKIMAYAYGFSAWDSYGFPVGGIFVDQNRGDVEAPSPVIAEIQGRENFTTDLNEVHGYVEDIDKNKNGNLAIIVNNKAYGYNTKIDYQRFIHGETKRVDFTVAMVDTTLDGLAIITFGDRSGNDSTISVQFKAKNIDREISVTKPIVNDKIELGKYITINWISNFPEDVKLELYKEENYVLTISEGEKNTGESIYQISTVVGDGNNFRIKASSVRDTNTFAFSNYFEITKTDVKKELTLIQPNLDTAIQRGKLLKINWTENIPFLVNVDLYLDNTLVKNFLSNSNKLAFDWLIPLDMEVSDKYKIKITDVSDNTIFVESENIKILVDDASKILTFNSPNSSTAVKMETELQINWECNFQDLVNISLNRSDTSFYYSIKAFQPNTGSFIWTVPNKLLGGKMLNEGMDYYIKITQKDNSKITFRSDNFQIYRFVSVKENESNAKLIISPNPPQTELTLEIDNGELIQNIDIYNLSAEKVFSLNRLNRTKDKVDVSNLPTGKYIIEVNTSKGMLTESFVIVR